VRIWGRGNLQVEDNSSLGRARRFWAAEKRPGARVSGSEVSASRIGVLTRNKPLAELSPENY